MDTSDLPTPVAEYLSANRTELFEFTETLVGYETQNPPGRTVDVVEWLETTLNEPALSVERFEVDTEKSNLIATLFGRTDRTLCFNGHLDTVPFDESDWSYEPLESPIVEAIAQAADHVVDDQVYRRSATGGGDAKVLRHDGIPTVEFGFGTQTANETDEFTTTETLVRNAISYGTLPVLYEQLTSIDG